MRVCPKCFSNDIVFAGETAAYAGLTTSQYYCKGCGYVGPVVIDMAEGKWRELDADRKKPKD